MNRIALALLAAMILTTQACKKPAPVDNTTALLTEPAGPLQPHVGAGLIISLPQNWKVSDTNNGNRIMAFDTPVYSTIQINRYGQVPGATDGKTLHAKRLELEAADPPQQHAHPDAGREITIAGEPAYRVVYTTDSGSLDEVYLVHQNAAYVISLSSGVRAYAMRVPTFEQALNTIQFDAGGLAGAAKASPITPKTPQPNPQ